MRMMLVFKKDVSLRHIGHLDLMRTMQRAFRRSGLPMAYSKGYNPHMIMSFAMPLSVGMWGQREALEVTLEKEVNTKTFLETLNTVLPPGIKGVGARKIEENEKTLMAQVAAATYEGEVFDLAAGKEMAKVIDDFLQQEEIVTMRKTKKGPKPCDIKPMIFALKMIEQEEKQIIYTMLSASSKATCKPSMLQQSLKEFSQAALGEKDVLWGRKGLFKQSAQGELIALEMV